MAINRVWEHNGSATLLYAVDFAGAYTRGETLEAAIQKMPAEISAYLKWCGKKADTSMDVVLVGEKVSELAIEWRRKFWARRVLKIPFSFDEKNESPAC